MEQIAKRFTVMTRMSDLGFDLLGFWAQKHTKTRVSG
jgi:hypothetical protein